MGQVNSGNLKQVFTYTPWDDKQKKQGEAVAAKIMELAEAIIVNVPECADRSTALRKLRELRMDCNAAITLDGLI